MTVAFLTTLIGGVALIATAIALMFWQILSAPDRPNYPTSGPIKRSLMFVYMLMLFGRGSEVFGGLYDVKPLMLTTWQFAAIIAQFGLFSVFLIDHCQHWLPARTHRHIRRLLRIAQCRPSPEVIAARDRAMARANAGPPAPADEINDALVELAAQGFRVAGPNEKQTAFTEN